MILTFDFGEMEQQIAMSGMTLDDYLENMGKKRADMHEESVSASMPSLPTTIRESRSPVDSSEKESSLILIQSRM